MSTDPPEVQRGEVYLVDLDPVVGHEQGGRRPFLIISINPMNRSAAQLAIGAPMTTTDRRSQLHVRLDPPYGGLSRVSFAMPEMIRSIALNRVRKRIGIAPPDAVEAVSKHVGVLIGLGRTR